MINKKRDDIIEEISGLFFGLGDEIGLTKNYVRTNRDRTEIYVYDSYALQIEIDWREYEIFAYVVRLMNGKIPDATIVYSYPDGNWCRKYLEEVYQVKRKIEKDRERRYSYEHLLESSEFYVGIIRQDPSVISNFIRNMD